MRALRWLAVATALVLACASQSQGQQVGSATLTWTAPGNDSLTGQAAVYDLRYSLLPITSLNFGSATPVQGLPPPSPAGTPESFTVPGLVPNTLYYFAIRTADLAGNWSGLSNVLSKLAIGPVEVATTGPPALGLSRPWPNPARGDCSLVVSLPAPIDLEVAVFDLSGRRVRTLGGGRWTAGDTTLSWDLRDDRGARVPAGLYRVRARLGSAILVRSVVVVG